MPHIEKISKKYKVDPISLMIEITKIDKVDLDPKILEDIASKLHPIDISLEEEFDFNRYVGSEQDE
jgi:hypothetical protein